MNAAGGVVGAAPVVVPILCIGETLAERELLGDGDGTFQPKVDCATDSDPRFVAVGDFDADGKPDLAVASYYTVNILLGNGDGTFQARLTYDTGASSVSVAVGDFDADGRPDLAVPN